MQLTTIQKRNKLNSVHCLDWDVPGPGGAHHEYAIKAGLPTTDGSTELVELAYLSFQRGPRNEPESRPGILEPDLLEIIRHRLTCFQAGPYATRENAIALTHIEEALLWLNKRVEDRAERGVLGTTKV